MSPSLERCSGSVTMTNRHDCRFEAVGAWIARRMQSRITSRGTGRSRSNRRRTLRVVVNNRSTTASSGSVNDILASLWRLKPAPAAYQTSGKFWNMPSPQAEELIAMYAQSRRAPDAPARTVDDLRAMTSQALDAQPPVTDARITSVDLDGIPAERTL